ncbi:uncharacterized protein [Mytilus edulis]|uniref:uncharacterized protein n=1 Tax=Mytilus edulis TaxID=6550 RepID=UPI0039F09264
MVYSGWYNGVWCYEEVYTIQGLQDTIRVVSLGQVRVGPFANWRYQTQDRRYVTLTRTGGSGRKYFPEDCYRNIIRESRNSRILEPLAGTYRNLEACHNFAHVTIGGTMNDIDVSPNDPVFYLHHCYVDKVCQDTIRVVSLGQVRVGPFANWRYQTQDRGYVTLTRTGGSGRKYFPEDCYRNIIRESRNSRILEPLAGTNRNLEACHNFAHVTIGGTMNDIDVSPNDPVFYLHHCYVDKVWQDFRDNSKSAIGHLLEKSRAHVTLTVKVLNLLDAHLDVVCQFCVVRHHPLVKENKRDVEYEDDKYKSVMDSSYQNSFVIDGEADVSQWAFIPVTLMYIRPMGQHFGCNPVRNGSIDDNDDIYSNDKSSKLWDYFKPGVNKRRVSDSQSGATKFFVQSDGISYKDRYIDYDIIDTRQMVYETVAYVGVKNPRSGSATSYVSVYDLHGHVCQPRCIDRSSKTLFYKKCSGVIKVTKEEPQMYGDDIAESVRYRYTYNFDGNKPTSNYRDIFLQFVCEYGAEHPWKDCSSKLQTCQTKTLMTR